jgi:hypothetical protein
MVKWKFCPWGEWLHDPHIYKYRKGTVLLQKILGHKSVTYFWERGIHRVNGYNYNNMNSL